MSFKRTANTDLNHDNWNEEQESEDAGEFKKASDDILQKRVKKVAKRRIGGDSDAPISNPFGGFGGFGTSTPAASSPFSFLSKLPAATSQTTITNKTNGEAKSSSDGNKTEKSDNSEYFSKVKSLNTAFVDWIKSNIDENKGLCDLTPIFKDYEKFMKECKELKDKKKPETKTDEKEATKSTFTFGKPATTNSNSFLSAPSSSPSIFSSIPKSDTISPAKPAAVPESSKPFSFGLAPTNSVTSNLSTAPSFSFGLQKTSTAITSAPLFGNLTNNPSAPFSFSNVGQNNTTATTDNKANEEEAEEEPPKNEFVPVVEDDSLYSKRCKVFVKSGADYADRGIGTLFLKKVDDKVQLIVRADTNLGNILLNIIICDGLPTSRLGKNNVMIVCLPTPESKPPPIPVLVRVKTADEADELLATLEKYKNAP